MDRDRIFTGAFGVEGSGGKAPCSVMLSSQMQKAQANAIVRTDGFFAYFFAAIYLPDFASLRFVVCLFVSEALVL